MLKDKTFKNFIRKNKKIEEIVFKEKYTFFFKYEKKIFATGEDGRLIFAKVKNKDKDIDYKNAKFIADDFKQKIKGEESSKYFSYEEIKKIKVVQLEKIIKNINGK